MSGRAVLQSVGKTVPIVHIGAILFCCWCKYTYLLKTGDSQVGKTSTLIGHTSQVCRIWFHTNIFDTYLVRVSCGSTVTDLEVWDTSGSDCAFSAFPNTHNGVNVYLLFFALNSTTSYQNVKTKWYPEIQRFAPEVPIVLIGTKSDTRDESVEGVEMVPPQMGKQLKEDIGACAYFECSAREKLGLVEVFEAAARYASPPHRSASAAEAPCEQPKGKKRSFLWPLQTIMRCRSV